jgi:hypothetical protein
MDAPMTTAISRYACAAPISGAPTLTGVAMSARRTASAALFVIAAAVLAPVSAAQASWFTPSWVGLFSFWGGEKAEEGCIPTELAAFDVDDCAIQQPQ